MKTGLSYDDVCLVPKCNNIESRQDPTTDTLLSKNVTMSIPIVAANMDTVIGADLAKVLTDYGSVPIFHRFWSQDQITEFNHIKDHYENEAFFSIGTGPEAKQVLNYWAAEGFRPMGVCVDVAHGHSQAVFEIIHRIRDTFPFVDIIAGNVCTGRAVHDLVNAGADAVKVGIGPGSACTTRNVTAFGRAQFSAVSECAEIGQELHIPIIADGGIKGSREIILALAAGASSVMIGGLFARSFEAAGKGKFRGQASAEFQQEFFGKVKQGTVPEGLTKEVELEYSANELIENLIGGLRSGMTYGGAVNIKELQRKAQFERITQSYF